MRDCIAEGRALLEEKKPGLFLEKSQEALLAGGVVLLSPDCVLMGRPCEDAPRTFYVVYACCKLGALYRALGLLRGNYDRIRWMRGWKNANKVFERRLSDFDRHAGLYDLMSKEGVWQVS